MSRNPFFKKYKVLIFAGNGGTGKTTMSSTWAELAASEGLRVGLLTIDPSRRLGSVYGMDLQTDSLKNKKVGSGSIDIFLIHSEKVIADFMIKEWGEQEAQKILTNKIFKQVSTTLSENQSLSTIYKLSEILKTGYDIVIVDTPPAHHTVDFFRSPQSVMSLFRDNVFAKMMGDKTSVPRWSPQSLFLRILTFLVGAEFIEQMSSFFSVLVRFQTHIVRAAEEIQKVLSSDQTCYFMVTLPEPFKVKELTYGLAELKKQGIFVRHIIANRAYPVGLKTHSSLEVDVSSQTDFNMYYKQEWEYYRKKLDLFKEFLRSYSSDTQVYFVPERSLKTPELDLAILGKDVNLALSGEA